MNEDQNRSIIVMARIRKIMYSLLDENDLRGCDRWLNRYNFTRSFYGCRTNVTLGQFVDDWYETRVFESKM